MKQAFGTAFSIFEIILSIVLANVLLVIGSVLSGFLLFPVLLISTLYYLRRIYLYREFTGIIFNYTNFIKGNIVKSIKLLFPLVLFVGFMLLSVFYYNQILTDMLHPYFILVIFVVQAFLLYQVVGVMIVSAILYGKNPDTENKEILNKAFIIFNAHPIRGFLSILSLAAGVIFIVRVLPFSYLIVFPIGLFFFYVVFSDIIEQKKYA